MDEIDRQSDMSRLDPARDEPGYWTLFQIRTMALVEPELQRRRRAFEQMTVSEMLTSWSRTVVPMAMAAAAAAIILILTEPGSPDPVGPTVPAAVRVAGPDAEAADDAPADGGVDGGLDPGLDAGLYAGLSASDPLPVLLTASAGGF